MHPHVRLKHPGLLSPSENTLGKPPLPLVALMTTYPGHWILLPLRAPFRVTLRVVVSGVA